MNKLLEVASQTSYGKTAKKRSKEEIELALAWLRGDVGVRGVMRALGEEQCSPTYCWLVITLKQAFEEGKILVYC